MNKNDEFYVPYIEGSLGVKTKRLLKRFVLASFLVIIISALVFSFFQKPAVNSVFDFGDPTKITGTYHESPYPMLRVKLAEKTYKDIVLLGFGKFGANASLDKLKETEGELTNKQLTIEGTLIYYNGKTLLEIDDSQTITLNSPSKEAFKSPVAMGNFELEGEIIDPKCYFGVMKPGYGKIHRSCAVRCISGGVPPVFASIDPNAISEYFLLTDLKGNPINNDVLPYIGKPSIVKGTVEKLEDWYIMKIDIASIKTLNKQSSIY